MTQPGPTADRIAELEREIAEREDRYYGENKAGMRANQSLIDDLQLSRLRNEQPKRGDEAARELDDGFPPNDQDRTPMQRAVSLAYEAGKCHERIVTSPTARDIDRFDECAAEIRKILCGELPSPAASPGPQDVLEADEFSRLDNFPLEYQRNYYRSMYKRADEAVEYWKQQAALSRSDAQPVAFADWPVSATECAKEIMTYLGIASDPSLEPGMDRRRDNVAQLIERHWRGRQSDAQPVGWRYAYRSHPNQWHLTSLKYDIDRARDKDCIIEPLYTAPYRPDASGLIEAADHLTASADQIKGQAEKLRAVGTDECNEQAGELEIIEPCLRAEANYLRARAADRSAK